MAILSRGSGAILQFLISIIIGRVLGAANLGLFVIYLSVIQIAAALGSSGQPLFQLRYTAKSLSNRDSLEGWRSWRAALSSTFLSSMSLCCFLFLIAKISSNSTSPIVAVLEYSAWSFPALAIIRLAAETIKGLKKANLGLALQFTFPQLLMASALLFLYFFNVVELWENNNISSIDSIIKIYGGLLIIVAIVGIVIVERGFFFITNKEHITLWQGISPIRLNFLGIELISQANARLPIIILPIFAAPNKIGQFAVATQIISISALILVSIASFYSPRFVNAFSRRDKQKLAVLLKQTRLLSIISFTPFMLLVVIFGRQILAVFGNEFGEAWAILLILTTAQAVNAVTGLVSFFNYMTNQEAFEMRIGIISLLIFFVSSFALGPILKTFGIAIAVAIAIITKNIGALIRARKTLREL